MNNTFIISGGDDSSIIISEFLSGKRVNLSILAIILMHVQNDKLYIEPYGIKIM